MAEKRRPKYKTKVYFFLSICSFLLAWSTAMGYTVFLDAVIVFIGLGAVTLCAMWGGLQVLIGLTTMAVSAVIALYTSEMLLSLTQFDFWTGSRRGGSILWAIFICFCATIALGNITRKAVAESDSWSSSKRIANRVLGGGVGAFTALSLVYFLVLFVQAIGNRNLAVQKQIEASHGAHVVGYLEHSHHFGKGLQNSEIWRRLQKLGKN